VALVFHITWYWSCVSDCFTLFMSICPPGCSLRMGLSQGQPLIARCLAQSDGVCQTDMQAVGEDAEVI